MNPASMPAIALHLFARFQKIPSTSAGKKAEAAIEKCQSDHEEDVVRLQGRHPGGDHRDDQQLRFRDHEAAVSTRRVPPILVEIVRQRV